MKIESVVALKALAAAIKRMGITMSASMSPIKMAVELGSFLIEAKYYDQLSAKDGVGAADGALLHFFKTLTDNAAIAEDAVNEFGKVLNDVPGVSEDAVFDFFKSLADTASVADAYASELSKPLSEIVANAEDHVFILTKKVKEDVVGIVEDEYRDFAKALAEAPALLTDDDVLAFFKNTQDTAGFTDSETRAFAKFLSDNVWTTDDIDGAASILDDQEMAFFKNTTDVAAATDVFFRLVSFSRAFSDTTALSDNDTVEFGKNPSDTASFTHTEYFDIGKPLSDTPRVLEQIALSVTLAPFTDAYGVTDFSFLTPGLGKFELASLTDTGSLRSQGYCDFTYFAEDYVGASRTF